MIGLIGSLAFYGLVLLLTPSPEERFMEAVVYAHSHHNFSEYPLNNLAETRKFLQEHGLFYTSGNGLEHPKRRIVGGSVVKVEGLQGVRINMVQSGLVDYVSLYIFPEKKSLSYEKLKKNIMEIKDYFVILWHRDRVPLLNVMVFPKQGKK